MPSFIKKFSEISIYELALVGGKNASLGEMFSQLRPKGILVPDGFAVTSEAYRVFLKENNLPKPLEELPPIGETTSPARDNTFVNPAPVTNWEWNPEGDGGEVCK